MNIKKAVILIVLAVIAALTITACNSDEDNTPAKTAGIEVVIDQKNPENSKVIGADNAPEAVDSFLNKAEEVLYPGQTTLVDLKSSELKQEGEGYVVISVACSQNIPKDDIGPYNSDPLFSVLKRSGDTWTFIRPPDEAVGSVGTEGVSPIEGIDLPPVLDNSETLNAGYELGQELAESMPGECQDS
jgi:hypothetical protein